MISIKYKNYLETIKEFYFKSRDIIIILLLILSIYLLTPANINSKKLIKANNKEIAILKDSINFRDKKIKLLNDSIYLLDRDNIKLVEIIKEIDRDRIENKIIKNEKIILVNKYTVDEQQHFFTARYKDKK